MNKTQKNFLAVIARDAAAILDECIKKEFTPDDLKTLTLTLSQKDAYLFKLNTSTLSPKIAAMVHKFYVVIRKRKYCPILYGRLLTELNAVIKNYLTKTKEVKK